MMIPYLPRIQLINGNSLPHIPNYRTLLLEELLLTMLAPLILIPHTLIFHMQ